jgi:soluble cytochrome b562
MSTRRSLLEEAISHLEKEVPKEANMGYENNEEAQYNDGWKAGMEEQVENLKKFLEEGDY